MLTKTPREELKTQENYFLALRPVQRTTNICLTGCQHFYELVSSFILLIFPLLKQNASGSYPIPNPSYMVGVS